MAALQELSRSQINEALNAAVSRQVPVSLSIRCGECWVNYHSRAVAVREEHLWIALPLLDPGMPPHEFAPAERVGLSFKYKHHKHIFSVRVAGMASMTLADGAQIPVLSVCLPTRMQRLQRRAYIRSDVPDNRIVRGSFWLGGLQAEPSGTSEEHPVWSGRVSNISAGGFQLWASAAAAEAVDIGDTVGTRIGFGAGEKSVYADAQVRHSEPHGERVLMGFQFMGLDQTSEGQESLQLISVKVTEFQNQKPVRCQAASDD